MQGVLLDPVFRQLFAAPSGHGGDGVNEFADEGGRCEFVVVADTAADVGKIKDVARADNGFEEKVAVVVAAGAVAFLRMFGNQVEHGSFGVAREIAVVQPQEADDFERQAPHRYHAAKGDAAAQESCLAFAA